MNLFKQLVVSGFVISALQVATAETITVVGSGSTWNVELGDGFDDPTYGEDRKAVFEAAAAFWADIVVSSVPIQLDADFDSSLYCVQDGATLGSAGPYGYTVTGYTSFGVQNNVIYPSALLNALVGSDLNGATGDISASFNPDIGDSDCYSFGTWDYDMDGSVSGNDIDFYEVVLHEIGHGLGVVSYLGENGSKASGLDDIYSTFLELATTGEPLMDMTSNADRASAMTSQGNLVWNGANVTALSGDLTNGVNGGQVQMYAPSSYEDGSSVSHFDTALSPNELMEPSYTGNASYDHTVALLADIGWEIYSPVVVDGVPEITGDVGLTTAEDTSITLSLDDFTVSDSDSTYPDDFTLAVSSGSDYSVSGLTVTPDDNFNGSLVVPVTVNDGSNDSDVYNLTINVTAVNDAPTISAQSALSVAEENDLTLRLNNFTTNDVDGDSLTLSVGSGANYSVSGTTITPATDFYGSLTVPVSVNDGTVDSATFNASVTVNAVNDLPEITSLPTVELDEDTTVTLSVDDFGISDPDSTSFTLLIESGADYVLSGSTIVPDTNFFGLLSVGVSVNDGASSSATETLSVTVNAVNDAPVISGTADTTVNANEFYSADFDATDVEGDSLTYSVSPNTSWFSIDGVSGELTGTPASEDVGTESVVVTVSDGSLTDTYEFDLSVLGDDSADVVLTLAADATLVAVNETAVVTLSIDNAGPANAVSGTVELSLPAGVSVVDTGGCSQASDALSCAFSNVTTSQSFEVGVSASAAMTANIAATVTPVQEDPNTTNNSAGVSLVFGATEQPAEEPVASPEASNTTVAVFGDVTADDIPEVIFGAQTGTDETLFEFNSAFDTLLELQTLNQDSNVNDIVVADLNGDAFLDMVFANDGANRVYISNSGAFGMSATLGDANSRAVIAVDVDADLDNDLVFANEGAGNTLYLNDGDGNFVIAKTFAGSDSTQEVAALHVNNDDFIDLVFVNSDADDVVEINDASLAFEQTLILGSELDSYSQSFALTLADLDGDGNAHDIVIGSNFSEGIASVRAYRVAANLAVSVVDEFELGNVVALAAGDFNASGADDLVVLDDSGTVQILNQSDVLYRFALANAVNLSVADVNEDDIADLIVVGSEGGSQLFISSATSGDVVGTEDDSNGSESDESGSDAQGGDAGAGGDGSDSNDQGLPPVSSGGSVSWLMLLLGGTLMLSRRLNVRHSRDRD